MERKELAALLRQEKSTAERDRWIWLMEKGYSVTEVFTSEGSASVALYEPEQDAGMADVLISEMSMAGVGVSCVVTDDAAGELICAKHGVRRVGKSELSDVDGLDFVVIISPENYHRRMMAIRRLTSAEVISLKGLIELTSFIYAVHLGDVVWHKQYNIKPCVLEWPRIGDFNESEWLDTAEKIVFSPKEYQENPERFSSLYDGLAEYSPDYVREIFQERPVVQVGGSVAHADCAGRHVNIINGRRLTTGQPDEAEYGVYVWGGCMAWGIGTDDGHTISSFLQRYINGYYGSVKSSRCAAYNLGIWGASSVPYIDFMKRDAKRKKLSVLVFRADGDYPKDASGRVYRYIKKFMDKHGICYINLTETLREAERRGTYLDLTHTNHRGYRAVAKKVFDEFVRPELERADADVAAVSNPFVEKWEKLRGASRSVSEFFTSQGMRRVGILYEDDSRGMFAELAGALTRGGVSVTVYAREDDASGGAAALPGVSVLSLSEAGAGDMPDIVVISAGEDVREAADGLARTVIVCLNDVIELVYDRYYLYPRIARRFAGSGAYFCVCLWPGASDLNLAPADYARLAEPLSEKMLERNYGYFKTYLYNEIPGFSIDYLREIAAPTDGGRVDKLSNADRGGKYVNVERGVRRTAGQPAGAPRRVRVFGGGAAFGVGAEDKYTLPSLLQEHLNTHAKNFGTESLRVENDGMCRDASDEDVLGRIFQALDKGDVAEGDVVIWLANKKYSAQDKTLFAYFADNLERMGIQALDLAKTLELAQKKLVYIDGRHVTHRGYRSVATKIYMDYVKNVIDGVARLPERAAKLSFADAPELSGEQNAEFRRYLEYLHGERADARGEIGAIVMNCNPFTLGHMRLAERAASEVSFLYIFVVEEDKSFFPFADRLRLVSEGLSGIGNVKVLPSGKFIISTITFPDYFSKDSAREVAVDTSLDLNLFAKYIAPALDIETRFAGTEPIDEVTRQYNRAMRETLPCYGVRFVEFERVTSGEAPISASRVRALLGARDWDGIRALVPDATYEYLREKFQGD